MKAKQVVSLLLAGQMLGAPVARAASLSRLEAAQWKEENRSKTEAAARIAGSELKITSTSMPHLSLVTRGEWLTGLSEPLPTVSPEAIPTAVPVSETTPSEETTEVLPTATPIPTAVPPVSPDVVPTPTAEPAPEITETPVPVETAVVPSATPIPEESPVSTATPVPEETAVPSATPVETPGIMPSPTAEPSPSGTPEPETTLAPIPSETQLPLEMMQSPVMLYATEREKPAFDYTYIGYGYEEYYAEAPDPDGKVKSAKRYSIPTRMQGMLPGQENIFAKLAVEKPARDNSAFFEGQIWSQEAFDDWVNGEPGWFSRDDGRYYLEDLGIVEDIDRGPVYSLEEIKSRLGRIPDYEFDDWYVSSLDLAMSAGLSGGSLQERFYLWDYGNQKFTDDNKWIIVKGDSYGTPEVAQYITRVPLAYGSGTGLDGQPYEDHPLTEVIEDIDAIKSTVVDTNEKRANRNLDYFYGNGEENDHNPLWSNTDLPIIAHWKLSSNATLIDTADVNADEAIGEKYETKTNALYLVRNGKTSSDETENLLSVQTSVKLYDKPLDDSDSQEIKFDKEKGGTYYIRLNSDVVGISPNLLASEAFKTEERDETGEKTPGLTISVRQAGEEKWVDYDCTKTILNDSKVLEDGSVRLYNSRQYPMRSMWTLSGEEEGAEKYIPLTPVKSSKSSTDLYNEVKITLVAPDGKAENVYTFYIQRLNDPWAVQNPGNTPFGMIARNTEASWLANHKGMALADIVATAKERFVNGYGDGKPYSFNGQLGLAERNLFYPIDSVENNGGQYEQGKVYYPTAWGGDDNLDLMETAIVVYQDSSFLDPGITVYDSQGDQVELDMDAGNIRRSVTLRVSNDARGLGTWDLSDGAGVDSYYSAADECLLQVGETSTFQVLRDPDGRDRIDLRGAKVIPGVYSIEYQFTDPLSNRVYGSDTEEYFTDKAKQNWKTFSRPLVILPLPGDVNMDGAVTDMDANTLEQALADAAGGYGFLSGDGDMLDLFRYRVCDVNNDGQIDALDVTAIREGFLLYFVRNGFGNGYYYIPLHTGLEESEEQSWRSRQPWQETDSPAGGKAAISLEYLGKNTDAITNDPAALAAITNVDEEGEVVPLERGDIFWVGVKLSGIENLPVDAALRSGGIDSLSLTIAYDKRYLKPATLLSGESWPDMIQRYNFGSGTAITDKYLWPDGLYTMLEDGCLSDARVLPLHSSEAVMPREGLEESWTVGYAKATLSSQDNATSYRILYSSDFHDDAYLLRVPFEVTRIPFNKTVLEGMDLQLSMKGMNLAYVQAGNKAPAAWNNTAEGIFGGASKNLADELTYVDGKNSARALPLAEDPNAEKVQLTNMLREDGKVIYGEQFSYTNTPLLANQPIDRLDLPAGLTAELLGGGNLSGTISGIPTETGTFAFETTGGTVCYIEVEKAPLHVAAEAQEWYYGEFDSGDLDYIYDPADIKNVDLKDGANYTEGFVNDGTSAMLAKLSKGNYSTPKLTTKATKSSDAGEYTIEISAGTGKCELPNYKYVYTDGTLDEGKTEFAETTGESAESPLMIHKRPLVVKEITEKGMENVVLRESTVQTSFRETATSRNSADPDYKPGYTLVDLSADSAYQDKLSGTPIYGDDVVALDFTAMMTWDDENGPPYYILTSEEETREAKIANLKLTEATQEETAAGTVKYPANKNYTLVEATPRTPVANATVKGNPVKSISVEQPPKMKYTYGEKISFSLTKIIVTYEDGTTAETTYGGDNWLASLGLSITWVSEKGKGPGPDTQTVKHNQELSAEIHHKKYLCVSAVKGYKDGKPVYECWYSNEPFEVSKKPLDLTAKPLTVYYGEFQDTMLDYTYNVEQLTEEDRNTLLTATGKSVLSGTSDELMHLPGYVAPALSAWKGDRANKERVTADTPVWWREGVKDPISYQIYIEDSADPDHETGALNYSFRYTRGSAMIPYDDYGLSDLTIKPRPIVVDSLTMGKYSDAFLYDDTRVLALREMWRTGEDGSYTSTLVSAAGQNELSPGADEDAIAQANADTFVANIPSHDYYIEAGNTEQTPILYDLSGDAIHVKADGVRDKVVVTYVAQYPDEDPSAQPPESLHFNMVVDGKTQTEKMVTASIGSLTLADKNGNDNGNYMLVYNTFSAANGSRPVNSNTEALVRLRPVKSIKIASAPARLSYTYGEQLDLSGMIVNMTYENEGDNAPTANQNVIDRKVNYRPITGDSDIFAAQGLKTYWVMDDTLVIPEELTPEMVQGYLDDGKLIPTTDNERYPDTRKDGKRLVLLGRRYDGDGAEAAGHVLVWTGDQTQFRVRPKTLPLTVEGKVRFYGEPNGQHRASFALTDLAAPDQKTVGSQAVNGRFYLTAEKDEVGSSDIKEVSTSATSPALSALNSKYLDVSAGETTDLGIRFTTRGMQGSDVGQYVIEIESIPAVSGNMANYVFDRNISGSLQVFRRPITVTKINKDPVSTIYFDTDETVFSAVVTQEGAGTDAFASKVPTFTAAGINSDFQHLDPSLQAAINAGTVTWPLPLTGSGVYGDDTVSLAMNVVFRAAGNRNSFDTPGNEGKYQLPEPVTVRDLVLTGSGEKNYYLYWSDSEWSAESRRAPIDNTATGQLDRRPITNIRITRQPKTQYTYLDTLDLSDLKVQVTYGVLPGSIESYTPQEELSYAQLAGRLSVNYWPNKGLPTNEDGTVNNGGAVNARKAASGDHLTIAPVHDKLESDATYYPADTAKGGFAHNGKYLILTARTHASMAFDAEPVFVEEAIKVTPRDLTYTLTAADKVYNEAGYAGKTATGGTITLSNPYTTTKTVTVTDIGGGTHTETQNDRDLIYVTTDVDYTALDGYADLADYLNKQSTNKEAYTFTATGAQGSKGLTFNFFDENVVYYDGTHTATAPVAPENWVKYWNSFSHAPKTSGGQGWDSYGQVGTMPVLVSNITLAGPDAANYTLDGKVGSKTDLSQNTANAEKAAVPYASIEKAEQAIISAERPTVSVDAHTNVVKVSYETGIDTQRNSGDQFKSELHYEYALEYQAAAPASPPLTQWGGADAWTDLPYFGGEPAEDRFPEGYVPTEGGSSSGSDNDKIVKGQNYPWEAEDTTFGDRDVLDRDTVYWGMVRLAETHNYKASESVHALADPTDAAAITQTEAEALQAAQDMSALVESWATNKPSEADTDPAHGPNPAVKTYKQSFTLYSTEEKNGADGKKYTVGTLEATWYTDIQTFAKKENLDAVVRNLVTTRYYNYYWDQDHSAEVKFEEGGLDLQVPFEVAVKRKTDSGTVDEMLTVNENGSAELYVVTKRSGGGGSIADDIAISGIGGGAAGAAGEEQSAAYVVGGEPITLEVEFKPASAVNEGILWTSSDPRVVQVDNRGKVFFVGVGTAVITATTYATRKTASVTITVTDPTGVAQGVGTGWETALALAGREENQFDFYNTKPIFVLDRKYQFHPDWTMTRGELVSILAQFYLPMEKETWDGEVSFPDLTGKETYAEAVELLRREGILTGLPDGSFGGEQLATRSEIAAILCRMMGLPPVEEDLNAFLDYGGIDTDWADGYVEALARAGVVLGAGEDYFHPERVLTREEAAAMLGRILLSGVYYGEDGASIIPTDVEESHWGYSLILRAVNTVVPRKK